MLTAMLIRMFLYFAAVKHSAHDGGGGGGGGLE
jgi:hypothetical protein